MNLASFSSSVPKNTSVTLSFWQILHSLGHGSPHRPIHGWLKLHKLEPISSLFLHGSLHRGRLHFSLQSLVHLKCGQIQEHLSCKISNQLTIIMGLWHHIPIQLLPILEYGEIFYIFDSSANTLVLKAGIKEVKYQVHETETKHYRQPTFRKAKWKGITRKWQNCRKGVTMRSGPHVRRRVPDLFVFVT